jgi:hypothetical protein
MANPDSPDCPVRNHLAAERDGRTRRGVEVPADYAFLEARDRGCLPVRFNPCEPIHYVINAALAPPGALDDLLEAIRRLEAATGLAFVNDGPTDEPRTRIVDVFNRSATGIAGHRCSWSGTTAPSSASSASRRRPALFRLSIGCARRLGS